MKKSFFSFLKRGRIAFVLGTFALTAIIGCKKDANLPAENQGKTAEPSSALTYAREYDGFRVDKSKAVDAIHNYRAQLKQAGMNRTVSTPLPLSEAVWYLESSANEQYGHANSQHSKLVVYEHNISMSTTSTASGKIVAAAEINSKESSIGSYVTSDWTSLSVVSAAKKVYFVDVIPMTESAGSIVLTVKIYIGVNPNADGLTEMESEAWSVPCDESKNRSVVGGVDCDCGNPSTWTGNPGTGYMQAVNDVLQERINSLDEVGGCRLLNSFAYCDNEDGYFINKEEQDVTYLEYPLLTSYNVGQGCVSPFLDQSVGYKLYYATDPSTHDWFYGFTCLTPAQVDFFRDGAISIIDDNIINKTSSNVYGLDFMLCNLPLSQSDVSGVQKFEHKLKIQAGDFIKR